MANSSASFSKSETLRSAVQLFSASRVTRSIALVGLTLLATGLLNTPVRAQQVTAASDQVKLNFPDPLPLKLLVDYVSNRLDIKILYGNDISNKKITIKAPSEIPAESLLNLLESSLKTVSYTHLTLPTIYSV